MCEACWTLIAKADDDEFLDSLELTYVERNVLEQLYKQGEERIMEILELQGEALQETIAELSEESLGDIGELAKVLISLHTSEVFSDMFEEAIQEAFEPLFHLAGESELVALDDALRRWPRKNRNTRACFCLEYKAIMRQTGWRGRPCR
ncbi:hypothetical protein [Paenibacillus sp. FSL W8-0194]|uniref:hypothetical protein n=1 Tax=Paenibacillus sp. FSL W8-0194 TaxID=2921711 RepID=UPI0030D774F0